MSWENIPGRTAYLWIYDEFLKVAPKGAIIVEVGVALGKSLAYLVEACAAAGRDDIRIFAVDSWAGTARNGEQQASGPPTPDGDYELFLASMRAHCPQALTGRVTIVRSTSEHAADWFEISDYPPDLVVIDAAHDYESVRADILDWACATHDDTWIGGDDYCPEFPGVIQAVNQTHRDCCDDATIPPQNLTIRSSDRGYDWGTWLMTPTRGPMAYPRREGNSPEGGGT